MKLLPCLSVLLTALTFISSIQLRTSTFVPAEIRETHIDIGKDYLTPHEATTITLKVYDPDRREIDLTNAGIVWENPSQKLEFKDQQGSSVIVTPVKDEGPRLDPTRILVTATLGDKNYSVSELRMIYRPWGERMKLSWRRDDLPSKPVGNRDLRVAMPWDTTTVPPNCPMLGTPVVYFSSEMWFLDGMWITPTWQQVLLNRAAELRIVREGIMHFAADFTIYEYEAYQIFTRFWIARSTSTCISDLSIMLEQLEDHWCACVSDYYTEVAHTFFANVAQNVVDYGTSHTLYARFGVDEWPDYIEWKFDTSATAPYLPPTLFSCHWEDGAHDVNTGVC